MAARYGTEIQPRNELPEYFSSERGSVWRFRVAPGVLFGVEFLKPPAFQFYVDDFLGGTVAMTHDERGLYITLLCVQWSQGSISSGDFERIAGGSFSGSLERVKAKFSECKDGLFRNQRLEFEREKQSAYRLSRSNNGSKGGRPLKAHGLHVVNTEKAQQKPPSPSPSPSPISDLREEHAHSKSSEGQEPTVQEVIAFGNGGSAIPEAYCRYFHGKLTETHGWIKNQRLIDWRKTIVRWWAGDRSRPQWLTPAPSSSVDYIKTLPIGSHGLPVPPFQ